jgi:hypothetical protein
MQSRISPNRIVVKQTCQGWKYQPAVKWVFGMVRSLTLKNGHKHGFVERSS